MAFPDTPAIVDTFKGQLQTLLTRMAQYDQLCDTLRGQVEGLQADKAALLAELERSKPLADEVLSLRDQLAAATARADAMEAHPDVIAARRASLEAQAEAIRQALERMPIPEK